jgi:hypothetical protein
MMEEVKGFGVVAILQKVDGAKVIISHLCVEGSFFLVMASKDFGIGLKSSF